MDVIHYPSAPWHLQGKAFCTLQWVDVKKAELLIPKELEIVTFWAKKTIGSIYLSLYGSGSTLEYSELIVAPAVVRYQGKFGIWISHIYVDNLQSVAGGREIWGLPKEMARFSWSQEGELDKIVVDQNANTLIHFDVQPAKFNLSTWRDIKLSGGCFGSIESQFIYFTNQFETKIQPVNSKFTIPNQSPLAQLELDQPLLTVKMPNLKLIAGQPHLSLQMS